MSRTSCTSYVGSVYVLCLGGTSLQLTINKCVPISNIISNVIILMLFLN